MIEILIILLIAVAIYFGVRKFVSEETTFIVLAIYVILVMIYYLR